MPILWGVLVSIWLAFGSFSILFALFAPEQYKAVPRRAALSVLSEAGGIVFLLWTWSLIK